MPPEFFSPRSEDPLDQPDASLVNFTNNYITGFSDRAATVSAAFNAASGVGDFIIWNEPTTNGTMLDADHFAALLHQCRSKMNPTLRIYWGGVDTAVGEVATPNDIPERPYINAVYQALVSAGLAGPTGPWPWTGINIHIHRDRSDDYIGKLFQMIDEVARQTWSDPGEVIVGEWGVTVEDQDATPSALDHLFNAIVPHGDKMFLFSHARVTEDGRWALIYWNGVPGGFQICGRSNLYRAYDVAVGPPDGLREPPLPGVDCVLGI